MRSRFIADQENKRSTLNVAIKSDRRGRKPRPIEEFPEALTPDWIDPDQFRDALALHMERHGDSTHHLCRAIRNSGQRVDHTTVGTWLRGDRMPQSTRSMAVLRLIERRYRLPEGYFKAKFSHPARATIGPRRKGISPAEQRRLAWHLPDDFDRRPKKERDAILEWVRTVIVTGATDYRRFQAEAMKHRYAIRFPALTERIDTPPGFDDEELRTFDEDPELTGTVIAPPHLAQEMSALVAFKTSTLTSIGFQRNGVWNDITSAQRVEHFGLLFGALAASPREAVAGFGVPLRHLSFAMLVFPSVWDWYVQWREHRRGFYTRWEVDMLRLGLALTRAETGWLRQNPQLAARLRPIPPLVSQADIEAAQADWGVVICFRKSESTIFNDKIAIRLK